MRSAFIAVALLPALLAAAPATAQPSADDVLRSAVDAAARMHAPTVRDYTLTMVLHGTRTPVYVERGSQEWEAHTPPESPLGEFMGATLLWLVLAPVEDDAASAASGDFSGTRYLREQVVDGRATHVIAGDAGEPRDAIATALDEPRVDGPDSLVLFVDAENGRVLRMEIGGLAPDDGGDIRLGEMWMAVDLLGHQAADGVVAPRRVHARMRMALPDLDAADRRTMAAHTRAALPALAQSGDPQSREMIVMAKVFLELLDGGELELPIAVEKLVVNAGPPAWLDR